MTPGVSILLFASCAVMASLLGVAPFIGRDRVVAAKLGFANAIAGGLMLGSAFALAIAVPGGPAWSTATGGLLGASSLFALRIAFAPEDPTIDSRGEVRVADHAKLLFVASLHASAEGIAIGTAVLLDPSLGAVMALTLAVHNIPEATALCGELGPTGLSLTRRAGLSLLIKLPQLIFGLATFGLVTALPGTLPWAAGFATGALTYVVMADLLPLAYREAGHTAIAVVTSAAMAVVVLLQAALVT